MDGEPVDVAAVKMCAGTANTGGEDVMMDVVAACDGDADDEDVVEGTAVGAAADADGGSAELIHMDVNDRRRSPSLPWAAVVASFALSELDGE